MGSHGEPGCIPILRLGPGLHSRGMRGVGRAVAGTAGALSAHHQDAFAPGDGCDVSQKLESKPFETKSAGSKTMAINLHHFPRISGFSLAFSCLFWASWPNRHIF